MITTNLVRLYKDSDIELSHDKEGVRIFGHGNYNLLIIDFKDMMTIRRFECILDKIKEGLLK